MTSDEIHVIIEAGPHDRRQCPVTVVLPERCQGQSWQLRAEDGSTSAVQMFSDGIAHFILRELPAGNTASFVLIAADGPPAGHPMGVVIEDDLQSLSIDVGGSPLTRYHYANVPARPYFYPLLTPDGRELTRGYPMRTDVDGESSDHPHHRSLWIAFGDVNGTDNWSEAEGHGSTRHDAVLERFGGPVCGQFTTRSVWIDSSERSLLTQRLKVTAWATSPDCRLLDFDIDLTATAESVVFGDTKEGGLLSIRVVGSMDVPRGGKIENSYGAIDEAETWGKAAHWCDYSGPVGDRKCGIAIMDHPLSFRYPTHWHVRNYGLMTANPFGYAAYTAGAKRGEHSLKNGETLRFRYRLLIHSGDATEGDVRGRYLDFVSPPKVTVVNAE